MKFDNLRDIWLNGGDYMGMFDRYRDLLDRGEYDSEEELCNALALNRDELYEDEYDDDDDE